jgi:hypothetical protein
MRLASIQGATPLASFARSGIRRCVRSNSPTLKILHSPLMLLRRRPRRESPKIFPLPSLHILLPRIQPILPRRQFSNHAEKMQIAKRQVGRKLIGASTVPSTIPSNAPWKRVSAASGPEAMSGFSPLALLLRGTDSILIFEPSPLRGSVASRPAPTPQNT